MFKDMLRAAVVSGALLTSGTAALAEPGVTDDTILIGDVNILTGPASFIGQAVSIGSKVAASEINENGGVNGRKIVVLTEDDGYVPARSFQAAKKLIEVDQVFALNGTSGTSNILAMLPLIEQHGVPVVVTTAPNERVYTPVRPSVFTIGADYGDAFFAMLKYIHENEEPANPVYGLIRQDDDFGASVEAGYDRAVEEFGVKDAVRLKFKRGQKDFGAEALQLRQAGVNVLANGTIIAGSSALLSELRKLGMDVKLANVWSEALPVSVKLSRPSEYPYYVADYVAALSDPASQKFMETAKKYLSEAEMAGINRYTLITYVGLKVLAEAMEQCGKDLTRACTIENLRKIKDFDTGGLTAPISFDNPQQLSGTAVKVYQLDLESGNFVAKTDFQDY